MLRKILAKKLKEYKDELKKDYFERIDQIEKEYREILEFEKKRLEKKESDSWFVDPEFVFSVSKGGSILLNGVQITTAELKNLKAEVRALKEFQIYKVIQSTLRQKAIEKAVLTSTDLYSLKGNEQVLAGKMMVFSLDIIKTIIQDIDAAKLVAK